MASKSDPGTYTKPELRDKIKEKITKGDKGGNPGQWSARKAQLVTQEYEKEGGDYKKPRNEKQKSLKRWGDEKWGTADGSARARVDGKTKRYLPEEAWKKLSPEEKEKTDRAKVKGSKKGQQFVANTPAAAKARKQALGTKPAAKNVVKTAVKKTAVKKVAAKKSTTRKTKAAPTRKATKKSASSGATKRGR